MNNYNKHTTPKAHIYIPKMFKKLPKLKNYSKRTPKKGTKKQPKSACNQILLDASPDQSQSGILLQLLEFTGIIRL